MKQELSVFSSEFRPSLKDIITIKFFDINSQLNEIEKKHLKKSVTEEVNENVMSIKNSIIDAVKEENLQNKVKNLEKQLLELDQKSNSLDQYNGRNNLEIQGISANVADDKLEEKVIDIFSCLGIEVEGADLENCIYLVMKILKIQ